MTLNLSRNILLTAEDEIKIADFGISRMDDSATPSWTPFRGTIFYMSPEMKAHQVYDFKTDIWYELKSAHFFKGLIYFCLFKGQLGAFYLS